MTPNDLQRIVIGIRKLPRESEEAFSARLAELQGLCEAAGGEVLAVLSQERSEVDAALYLGSGKVDEIRTVLMNLNAGLVVMDGELSPAQIRNLENRLDCRVIDRTQLILDIFALRARSREGRLQVEIAQLQYLLPRLTGRGVEMSRQGGGIGTRGPGETRLEVDRRHIRRRITALKEQLQQLQSVRKTRRDKRSKEVPIVALVGYTNAGKTTLLHRWTMDRGTGNTNSGDARLFDTLDPVARRVKAGVNSEIVLLDTVGFVQELPHLLVESFRATLEEALGADLIVHVVDASADHLHHVATTYQVLEEIGAADKPVLTFFNKADLMRDHPAPDPRANITLFGSAATGENLAQLYEQVERLLGLNPVSVKVSMDADEDWPWRLLARFGRVEEANEVEGSVLLRVEQRMVRRLQDVLDKQYPEVPPVAVVEYLPHGETDGLPGV